MNTYYKQGGAFVFKFDYDQTILNAVKNIPTEKGGKRYDPNLKEWTIDMYIGNYNHIQNLIAEHDFKLIQTPKVKINAIPYLNHKDGLKRLKLYKKRINELGLKYTPRPYQWFAIDYWLMQKSCINGDDMGIGKTLESIFAVEIAELFPCLVVVPSNVKYTWKNVWLNTNPNRSVTVINSGKEIDWDADVIIITYGMLGVREKYEGKDGEIKYRFIPKFSELINMNWGSQIFDEFHNTKHNKRIKSEIIKKISKNVEYKVGLTGTAIEKKVKEIINPLIILGWFETLFGNWRRFIFRYCDAKPTKFGMDYKGASNTIELNEILRDYCYFRRELSEVKKDLPSLQKTVNWVDLDSRRKYDKAENDLRAYIKETGGNIAGVEMAEFLVLRNVLRQLACELKYKSIKEWIDNFLSSTDRKLLVFGIHVKLLEKFHSEYDSYLIYGNTKDKDKFNYVEEFKKPNGKRIMFGNMISMGTGTDGLQHGCSDMLVMELPDNPSKLEQAISRIKRDGQKNSTNCNFMLGIDTIDNVMYENLNEEMIVTNAVNKGVEAEKVDDLNKALIKYYSK